MVVMDENVIAADVMRRQRDSGRCKTVGSAWMGEVVKTTLALYCNQTVTDIILYYLDG